MAFSGQALSIPFCHSLQNNMAIIADLVIDNFNVKIMRNAEVISVQVCNTYELSLEQIKKIENLLVPEERKIIYLKALKIVNSVVNNANLLSLL